MTADGTVAKRWLGTRAIRGPKRFVRGAEVSDSAHRKIGAGLSVNPYALPFEAAPDERSLRRLLGRAAGGNKHSTNYYRMHWWAEPAPFRCVVLAQGRACPAGGGAVRRRSCLSHATGLKCCAPRCHSPSQFSGVYSANRDVQVASWSKLVSGSIDARNSAPFLKVVRLLRSAIDPAEHRPGGYCSVQRLAGSSLSTASSLQI